VAADADIKFAGPDLASSTKVQATLASTETLPRVSLRTTPAPVTLNALLGEKSALDAFEVLVRPMP
jgi:hypothetical protein